MRAQLTVQRLTIRIVIWCWGKWRRRYTPWRRTRMGTKVLGWVTSLKRGGALLTYLDSQEAEWNALCSRRFSSANIANRPNVMERILVEQLNGSVCSVSHIYRHANATIMPWPLFHMLQVTERNQIIKSTKSFQVLSHFVYVQFVRRDLLCPKPTRCSLTPRYKKNKDRIH